MHANGHSRRLLIEQAIDEHRIAMRQFIGIVAALTRGLAHFVVAEVGEVRIVELHQCATRLGQRMQLRGVSIGDILVKLLQIGIRLLADAAAAAAEMQHRRRRNRHLRRAPGEAVQILKVRELNVLDVTNLAGNANHRR